MIATMISNFCHMFQIIKCCEPFSKLQTHPLVYWQDYWSTSTGPPTRDTNQNLTLVNATESGGYTMVEFYRPAMTGDTANDVQFMVSNKYPNLILTEGRLGASQGSLRGY